MRYSVIVPVYNRPDEVRELLESLAAQDAGDFEVIVVEDGSTVDCRGVVAAFPQLRTQYIVQQNAGPSAARNRGAEHASGEWLVILDSDCVLPGGYFRAIDSELAAQQCDAFGGPDSAHPSFTPVQKAINYSMTSFFTTGGIRGGRRKLDKFYPRSFNMGIRRELYRRLGGFNTAMRYGEDIDMSLRIFQSGAACRLFPGAWVWHKRRTSFGQFFRQVRHSGEARIDLNRRHPGSMKAVHTLPALFTVGVACCCLYPRLLPLLLLYALVVMVDSWIKNGSVRVAALSVVASYIQLIGYGTGFIAAAWRGRAGR